MTIFKIIILKFYIFRDFILKFNLLTNFIDLFLWRLHSTDSIIAD